MDFWHFGGGYQRLAGLILSNRLFLLGIVILFLTMLLHAIEAGRYADFFPINGTFQNYNPVRRLLSGQVPYRDFQDYLGMGHLFLGSFTTALFGGGYTSSLSAFSFLAIFSFSLMCYVIGNVILKNREATIFVTIIIIVLILVQPLIFTNFLAGTDEIIDAMDMVTSTGNSARYLRGMILPISVLVIYIGMRHINKQQIPYHEIVRSILAGTVGGFSFVWSNDYGISCCFCLFVMNIWLLLCERKRVKTTLICSIIHVISSVVSVFAIVEIFTLGHFSEWLQSTFGTGGYQKWYFPDSKSYYIWDFDVSFLVLLQAGICIWNLYKMMAQKNEKIDSKHIVVAYVNMTGLCAMEEYRLFSGGYNREVALGILFITIIFEIVSLIFKGGQSNPKGILLYVVGTILGMSWIISASKDEFVFRFLSEKDGIYVEELGANSSLGEDLINTDKFLDGETFFSTYASAQEVLSDIYQPSGIDYIIHVLGDDKREQYVEDFKSGDFTYTATINENYTSWESWIRRANWFFYRQMLSEWHPTFANSYEIYWERNDVEETNTIRDGYELEIVEVDDATVKIIINCDEQVNGIADVYIDYKIEKRDRKLSKFNIFRKLSVVDTGITSTSADHSSFFETNYLRAESSEYIPISVVNGYGEVTLYADPNESVLLHLYEAKCNRIFTALSDYLFVSMTYDTETGSVICIPKSDKNIAAMSDATDFVYGDRQYSIDWVGIGEEYISIGVAEKVESSDKNVIQILR